ncbi:MAG: hypothetical protein IJZ25_04085 [Lachnospiraceae bacterium]|nr:hypothetical protein [Lachnospiraceae bacterium]
MKNFKRFMCLFMMMVMVLSMTACKKEEEKKQPAGASAEDIEKVEDIFGALDLGSKYVQGYYLSSVVFDVNVDGIAADGSMVVNGKTDGKGSTSGFSIDFEDVYLTGTNVMIAVDDKAYIDVDSLVECLAAVETTFGALEIPLPEMDKKVQEDMQKQGQELMTGLVKAAFKDIEAVKNGDAYVIEVKTAEECIKIVNAALDYISENKDAINDYYNTSATSVDTKAYLVEFVEFYRDDLIDTGKIIGEDITNESIDDIIAEIENVEIPEVTETDFLADVDFEALKTQLEAVDAEELQGIIDANGIVLKLSVTATTDFYGVEVTFAMDGDAGKADVAVKYEFRVNDSVEVTKPSNVTSIAKICETLDEDQELMAEISSGLMKTLSDFGSMGYYGNVAGY